MSNWSARDKHVSDSIPRSLSDILSHVFTAQTFTSGLFGGCLFFSECTRLEKYVQEINPETYIMTVSNILGCCQTSLCCELYFVALILLPYLDRQSETTPSIVLFRLLHSVKLAKIEDDRKV